MGKKVIDLTAGTAVDTDIIMFADPTTGAMKKTTKAAFLAGVSSGAYSQVTAYTASIPFNKPVSVIKNYGVNAAITFAPNTSGAVAGNGCTVTVTMTGVGSIGFDPAFKALSTSDTFDNTLGKVHLITFYYDGTYYYYSISKAGTGALPDNIIPAIVTATMEESNPSNIVLTFNKPLNATIVAAVSQFTPKVNSVARSVTGVAISGAIVTLTLVSRVYVGEAVTLDYAQATNNLQDTAASPNLVAAFTNQTVTNNITSGLVGYVQFTTALDVDMVLANGGLRRAGGSSSFTSTDFKYFQSTNQLSVGKLVQFKNAPNVAGTVNGQKYIVLTKTPTASLGAGDAANYSYGLMIFNNTLYEVIGGTGTSAISGETPLVNGFYKIAYETGAIRYYKSTDGISWTLIKTASAVPTGTYFIAATVSERGVWEEIRSDVESGSFVLGTKALMYVEPAAKTTTLIGWTGQNVNATSDIAADGGVQKIRLISGTNQAWWRVDRLNFVAGGASVTGVLNVTVSGVTINSGKLFFRIASLGQVGFSRELTAGTNTFTVDLSTITDSSYIWLASDTVANGGGNGFIGRVKIDLQ